MAKTRERKLEVARRIHDLVCDEHGMDPQLLIFDALTFTLTTGDEEWRPSAVETIEGIRLIKAELPGVLTSLGVSNVSLRHRPAGARGPQLRLPAPLRGGRARPRDGQPEPHHAVRRRSTRRSASSPTTSSSTGARTRSSASSPTSRSKSATAAEAEARRPDRRHGARGGAALAHPAPQEGRRGGPDRRARSRRSARCRRSTTCCCRP